MKYLFILYICFLSSKIIFSQFSFEEIIIDPVNNNYDLSVATGGVGYELVDFDEDGDDDVFVIHAFQSLISVDKVKPLLFENDGNGRFELNLDFKWPFMRLYNDYISIDHWDFDNDGDKDLLFRDSNLDSSSTVDSMYIAVNNGNGNFSLVGSESPGSFYTSLNHCIGDMNNDGYMDIVSNYVYLNNGNYAFEILDSGSYGQGWNQLADVDLDGSLDLIHFRQGYYFEVFLNNGNGVLTIDTTINEQTYATFLVEDIDMDGDPDIIVSGRYSIYEGRTIIYWNNNGTFTPDYTSGIYPVNSFRNRKTPFIDYDYDGDKDLLLLGPIVEGVGDPSSEGYFGIYENDGIGNFTIDSNVMLPFVKRVKMNFGYINSDTLLDVMICAKNAGDTYNNTLPRVYILFGEIGGFKRYKKNDVTPSLCSAYGDIDLDGDLDLFLTGGDDLGYGFYSNNENNPRAHFYRNVNGNFEFDSTFWFTENECNSYDYWSDGFKKVFLQDVNNDGYPDLILSCNGDTYLNYSGTFYVDSVITNTTIMNASSFADIDGDSDVDAVVIDPQTGMYSIAENDGNGNYTTSFQSNVSSVDYGTGFWGHQISAFFDFDQDGDLDIVMNKDSNVAIMINDGFGGFTTDTIIWPGNGLLRVADFDGNGFLDIFLYYDLYSGLNSNPHVPMLFLNGGGFISEVKEYNDFTSNDIFYCNDLNNDGAMDIIIGNPFSWGCTWLKLYLNNGNAEFDLVLNDNVNNRHSVVGDVLFFDVDGDNEDDIILPHSKEVFIPNSQGQGYVESDFQFICLKKTDCIPSQIISSSISNIDTLWCNDTITVVNSLMGYSDCGVPIYGVSDSLLSFSSTGSYTVNWAFQDFQGNPLPDQFQTITIFPSLPPVPSPFSSTVDVSCASQPLISLQATDDCDGLIQGIPNISYPIPDTTQSIVWSFIDSNNDTVQVSQTVNWVDFDLTLLSNNTIISTGINNFDSISWVNCDNGFVISYIDTSFYQPEIPGNYQIIYQTQYCIDTSNCVFAGACPYIFIDYSYYSQPQQGINDGVLSINPINGANPYSILWSTGSSGNFTHTNLGAGDYWVKVTDNNGCAQLKRFQVYDYDTSSVNYPSPDTLYADSVDICVPFEYIHTEIHDYYFFHPDSIYVNWAFIGAAGEIFIKKVAYYVGSNFQNQHFVVELLVDCIQGSYVKNLQIHYGDIFIGNSPYLFDAELDNEIIIYPNPFKDKFTIEHSFGKSKIELFNLFGQKVFESEVSGKQEVDFNLATGTYFLLFHTPKKVVLKKIVKE